MVKMVSFLGSVQSKSLKIWTIEFKDSKLEAKVWYTVYFAPYHWSVFNIMRHHDCWAVHKKTLCALAHLLDSFAGSPYGLLCKPNDLCSQKVNL